MLLLTAHGRARTCCSCAHNTRSCAPPCTVSARVAASCESQCRHKRSKPLGLGAVTGWHARHYRPCKRALAAAARSAASRCWLAALSSAQLDALVGPSPQKEHNVIVAFGGLGLSLAAEPFRRWPEHQFWSSDPQLAAAAPNVALRFKKSGPLKELLPTVCMGRRIESIPPAFISTV